jgi:hypothetical protein
VKKTLLPFFLLIISSISLAQLPAPLDKNYSDRKNSVNIFSDYFFSSTAVTNAFVRAYLKNSYLDSSLKMTVSDRLKANNSLGGGWNTGFSYSQKNKEKQSGWTIIAANRLYADAYFKKDFFELMFYGNAKYKGKNADLNGFSSTLLKYQQVGFGIYKEKEKMSWGLTGSLLKGQEYLSITAERAGLYTAEDGEYIDIDARLEIQQSDSSQKKISSFNGMGFSADFHLSFGDEKKGKILFEIRDLGLIAWNSKSVTTTADTLYHFEGVDVENIFKLEDSTLVTKSDTSYLEKFIDSKTAGSYSSILPVLIRLRFSKELKENKSYLQIGACYRYTKAFTPMVYASLLLYSGEKFFFAPGLTYGGFGKLSVSLQVGKDFGKGFLVYAGSRHLEGFVMPKSTTSQGAEVSLRKFF